MKTTLSMAVRQGMATLLAVGSVLLSGVAQPNAPKESKNILVDGSSTVAPITKAVAEEFKKTAEGKEINVTVGVSGTSGGFRRFVVGETDISDASRAIKSSEIDNAKKNNIEYVELLIALDGLTVAVARNTQIFGSAPVCLTIGELDLLWAREAEKFITKWNQVRVGLANAEITLSGAASTSGTFDFFNDAVHGNEKDTRSDYFGTEEDQLLAQQTGTNPHALTYFGFAFFLNNSQRVQAVAIDPRRDLLNTPADVLAEINKRREANIKKPLTNGGGQCKGVLPSVDTIESFSYIPFTRPLFIYVNKKSGERPAIDSYIKFYLSDKSAFKREFMLDVGYLPTTRALQQAAVNCWSKRKAGTAFGGDFGGLTLQEINEKYQAHCNN
jgi:phosphate transport system substrate-binding protein